MALNYLVEPVYADSGSTGLQAETGFLAYDAAILDLFGELLPTKLAGLTRHCISLTLFALSVFLI